MILQLGFFSLLLLFLLLVAQFVAPVGSEGPLLRGPVPRNAAQQAARLHAVIREAVAVYALFAPYALYMYLQGKPDLLPQYLAWAVVALEVLKGALLYLLRWDSVRFLGVVSVAILFLLWLLALPVFQAPPA